MESCDRFEPWIERMLADEIDEGQRDRLLAHAEGCRRCREFVDLHHRLLGHELEMDLPTDEELASMRASVLREIRVGRARGEAGGRPRWTDLMRVFAVRPAFAAGLAALLLAVLSLGVLIGRQGGGDGRIELGSLLAREARGNRGLSDVEESPFLYSNIVFQPTATDTLDVSFDVTRHVELRRAKDDPLVKEVLVQSLLSQSPVGTRLEAATHAAEVMDTKVRQALLMTMLSDPSQAVRARALELLAGHRDDPEVQIGLLSVLRAEESVHMRLMALDQLAASDLSADRFESLLDELSRPEDRALLVRAASYGREEGGRR